MNVDQPMTSSGWRAYRLLHSKQRRQGLLHTKDIVTLSNTPEVL